MRIRSSSVKCSSVSFPSSYSSHSQSSASSSSSDPPSILPHSFDSSENPSSPSSSCHNSTARCEGLDLLVMAVHYLAGSIVGVPFAQKRVVRRRKRAVKFNNLIISGVFCGKEDEKRECKEDPNFGFDSKPTREKRVMALPSKYRDSVLQPWKRRNRNRSIGGRSDQ